MIFPLLSIIAALYKSTILCGSVDPFFHQISPSLQDGVQCLGENSGFFLMGHEPFKVAGLDLFFSLFHIFGISQLTQLIYYSEGLQTTNQLQSFSSSPLFAGWPHLFTESKRINMAESCRKQDLGFTVFTDQVKTLTGWWFG